MSDSGAVTLARANLPQRRAGVKDVLAAPQPLSPHTQPSGNDTLAARSHSAAARRLSNRGHIKQLHCLISNSPAQPSTPCQSQISAVPAAWPARWPSTSCSKERSRSPTVAVRITVQPRLRCFFSGGTWALDRVSLDSRRENSAPNPRLWRHAPSGVFVHAVRHGMAWHGQPIYLDDEADVQKDFGTCNADRG